MNWLNKALKFPLHLALGSKSFRQKLIYELRRNYFADLQFQVPLTADFSCPILQERFAWSFSEIFLNSEYGSFLKETGLPRRWLDIGCHAGFFSVYLAWQHRIERSERFEALLIDADPRVEKDVSDLITAMNLTNHFRFKLGAIGAAARSVEFALREGMASSAAETGSEKVTKVAVPILTPEEIARLLPGPYDVIKIDVEGAEDAFIERYQQVYNCCKFLILEWHSWDAEGMASVKIQQALKKEGFDLSEQIQSLKTHKVDERVLTTGCHLYRNLNMHVPAGSKETAPRAFAEARQ
jgi:FkbM family methyltransferase